jgi:DNA polymerase-4
MIRRRGITLIGVALSNLDVDPNEHPALPFDRPRAESIDAAVDGVRDRFGSAAITRAVLLDRAEGLSVPLLPD